MLMVWHYGSIRAASANGEMQLKSYSPACPPLLSHPAIAEPWDKLAWQAVPLLGRQVCSPRCGRAAESHQALRNASPGTCREPTSSWREHSYGWGVKGAHWGNMLSVLWWGDSDWAGWLFVIFKFAYHFMLRKWLPRMSREINQNCCLSKCHGQQTSPS